MTVDGEEFAAVRQLFYNSGGIAGPRAVSPPSAISVVRSSSSNFPTPLTRDDIDTCRMVPG